MRNEAIVQSLIEMARTGADAQTKGMAQFALMKMKEQRTSLIPGRKCLDAEASQRLYDRLVAPALAQLPKKQ